VRVEVGHAKVVVVNDSATSWDVAIARFRELNQTDAGRAYLRLLEGAQARWEATVQIHPWRLDLLRFEPRGSRKVAVQVEYRVRYSGFVDGVLMNGQSVMHFRLGPPSMNLEPLVTGDICRHETGPVLLEAFLSQIASPS
jgi:hypothetical protein